MLHNGLFGSALLEDHWLVSSASQSEQIKGTPSAMNLAAPRTLVGSFFAPVKRLPRRPPPPAGDTTGVGGAAAFHDTAIWLTAATEEIADAAD